MEQVHHLFCHRPAVDEECKLFIKAHERPLLDAQTALEKSAQFVDRVNNRFILVSADAISCLAQARARILVCSQVCERIFDGEVCAAGQVAEVPEYLLEVCADFETQLEKVNSTFNEEIKELKDIYDQMKESLEQCSRL